MSIEVGVVSDYVLLVIIRLINQLIYVPIINFKITADSQLQPGWVCGIHIRPVGKGGSLGSYEPPFRLLSSYNLS